MLPGPALTPLADAGLLDGPIKTILALWRAPEQLAADAPWQRDAALVDIASFGEIGLLRGAARARRPAGAIPHGAIAVPRGAPGAVAVAETMRSKTGTLALRGPMVPTHAVSARRRAKRHGPRHAGRLPRYRLCLPARARNRHA